MLDFLFNRGDNKIRNIKENRMTNKNKIAKIKKLSNLIKKATPERAAVLKRTKTQLERSLRTSANNIYR